MRIAKVRVIQIKGNFVKVEVIKYYTDKIYDTHLHIGRFFHIFKKNCPYTKIHHIYDMGSVKKKDGKWIVVASVLYLTPVDEGVFEK